MSPTATHCARCESAIAADDLRCPVCNLTCPASHGDDLPETSVEILRCSGCGAAMTYEVKKRAAACAFCGSVLELEHPADPLEEARILLPFTVDGDQARAAFREWLGVLGWFRPGDLISGARLETIQPLRWVGWVFDARAELSWTADTDHDTRRAAWAPHSGRADLEFDDVVVPATRGLTHKEAVHLLASYDLSSAADVSDVVDDATVERFDVLRSAARQRLIEVVEQLSRRHITTEHTPGHRVRNLHTSIVLQGLDTRHVAFPAWVLAYRYKDRLFRTVLSGQDANCLMGEAPYSTARIVVAVVTAGVAMVGFVLIALLL